MNITVQRNTSSLWMGLSMKYKDSDCFKVVAVSRNFFGHFNLLEKKDPIGAAWVCVSLITSKSDHPPKLTVGQ